MAVTTEVIYIIETPGFPTLWVEEEKHDTGKQTQTFQVIGKGILRVYRNGDEPALLRTTTATFGTEYRDAKQNTFAYAERRAMQQES